MTAVRPILETVDWKLQSEVEAESESERERWSWSWSWVRE